MEYVDYVYNIISTECEGMDSVYGDYIVRCVGVEGLDALLEHRLLETCGVINGRQLFTIFSKKETAVRYSF